MAPRDTIAEEVFTDLSGNVDTGAAADAEILKDPKLGTLDDSEIKDEDLQVVADEEEGDSEEAAEEGDEDEEEGEEEEQVAADPGSDFDPKDVLLLVKDAGNLELRENMATSAQATAKADIEAAKAAMETAQEAGDTKANIAATEKYTAATIALQAAGNQITALAGEKAALAERAKVLYAAAPKDAEGKPILDGKRPAVTTKDREQTAAQRPSKLVNKFKAQNPWFGNAKFAKQTERLRAIDRGMAAEGGWDKDTPEYFAELGKRLNREHPGIFKTLDGKQIATGQRQRTAGGPIPGQGGTGAGSGGGGGGAKVKLTTADLEQMRAFKMDPSNMDHRRQWLASKIEQVNSGRN